MKKIINYFIKYHVAVNVIIIAFLLFGIFVMWFLAFYMGFSQPISSKKIDKIFKKHFI